MKERLSNGFELLNDGVELQKKLITKVTSTQMDMGVTPNQSEEILLQTPI